MRKTINGICLTAIFLGLTACISDSSPPPIEGGELQTSEVADEQPSLATQDSSPIPVINDEQPPSEVEDIRRGKIVMEGIDSSPRAIAGAFQQILLETIESRRPENRDAYEAELLKDPLFRDNPGFLEEQMGWFFEVSLFFALADLEGDGVPELILANHIDSKIYRYSEGTIYEYGSVFARGFQALSTNGTFIMSGGASVGRLAMMSFADNRREEIILALWEPRDNRMYYSINDEEVTEEEWQVFMDAQERKESVVYHDLTEVNVLRYVKW